MYKYTVSSDHPINLSGKVSRILSFLYKFLVHAFLEPLSKGRKHRTLYRLTLFAIIALLLPLFNFSPNLSVGPASAAGPNVFDPPPAPEARQVPPVTDPHLPTLSVQMQITPHQIAVGDTFTVTLTVNNSAPDAASNVEVALPVPQGVTKLDSFGAKIAAIPSNPLVSATPNATILAPSTTPTNNPNSSPSVPTATPTFANTPGSSSTPNTPSSSNTPIASVTPTAPSNTPTTTSTATVIDPSPTSTPTPTDEWTWQLPTLAGNGGSATFVATARLDQAPVGDAILAGAQVTADGLSLPIVRAGGALFLGPNRGSASSAFVPGTPVTLQSQDGRTQVQVPANAYTQTLTLQHTYTQTLGLPVPPEVAGLKKGLGTFYLNATDALGSEVHQFSAPLTLTVSYTPQQLEATGISEGDLTLFWYDDSDPDYPHWTPIDTQVDSINHRATAQLAHFSAYQFSDGSSPSAAFLPSLQGWQVGLYQGDVSYQYPIDVPAGPGGVKPGVSMSYNSSSTDGIGGQRRLQQSSWVGKGWSLNTGYVALNRLPGESGPARYFSMVFNGQSFDLVRGAARVGSPSLSNPSHWEWNATNEGFVRARAESNGVSYGNSGSLGRGGFYGGGGVGQGTPYTRYKWQAWTKDGTRYDFEEDSWQGNSDCGTEPRESYLEAYKWQLTRVEDTHGNRINYSYGRYSQWRDLCTADSSRHEAGWIDGDIWPTQITWGGNWDSNNNLRTPERYKVEFYSVGRTIDTTVEPVEMQITPSPVETRQLLAVKVWSNQSNPYNSDPRPWPDGPWELVRQYNLGYADGSTILHMLSDYSTETCNPTCTYGKDYFTPKLTLTSLTRVANDGVTALPATTFSYHQWRGNAFYPNGQWNRLEIVNNGQGGTVTFGYETIGNVIQNTLFRNNRRVHEKTVTDGRGNSYPWSYSYENPTYNSIGTNLSGAGTNALPNSASVYYADVKSRNDDFEGTAQTDIDRTKVVHKRHTEFRGHSTATETDPNGNQTKHWFIQGDAGCTPNLNLRGDAILSDSCFIQIRNKEFAKGREWKTASYQGGVADANRLQEGEHTFYTPESTVYYGHDAYSDDKLSGLWRAFTYESQTVERAYEKAGTPITKTTDYTYETTYGNLTLLTESDSTGVVRRTEHQYIARNDASTYIVDRPQWDIVRDVNNNLLAHTIYGYDGSWGDPTMGTTGNLTLVRKYYNLPLQPNFPNPTLSSDASFTYDDYGNQTGVTTYGGPGNGWGQPGGGVSPRTTTTTFDTTFHAFSTQVTPPTVNGVTLQESATYDYRMGALQSVTGPNGSPTTVNARYDIFGRMVTLWKPGDSEAAPTIQGLYYDNEVPFKYEVRQYEVAGSGAYRPTFSFYDGLGRKLQTKAESLDSTKQVITDTRYDGLGQATQQSQPREVTQSGGAFGTYLPPTDPNIKWTTTTYDGLGRPLTMQEPNNTSTQMEYTLYQGKRAATVTDAKGHKTRRESDMLGRLVHVGEYSGETQPYIYYSGASYAYSPLDLLTTVTDGNGKQTTMQYDSLGRKVSMVDLTMGAWAYGYDVNGNLTQQTDARGHQITFTYDALNRLESKSWPYYGVNNPAESLVYRYDQTGTGYANGKGQRTSILRCTGVANNTCSGGTQTSLVQWQYDTRGQQTSTTYTLQGLSGARTMSQTYDRGGRVTSMTYPTTGEVVSYTYDAAWRQISACSSTYTPCYANNASYTALDQPITYTLGNSLSQTYGYDSLMQRLTTLQVGAGGSVFNRGYTYDPVGNVQTITGSPTIGTQTFGYDHRDRLTNWTAPGLIEPAVNQTYSYDLVGNILSKAGAQYTYDNTRPSGAGGPYAVQSANGTTYTYDNNGNILGGGARNYTWNTENQPTTITTGGTTETYTYDADNARIKKTMGNTNTYYIGGMYEEDVVTGQAQNTTRTMYTFGGQVIAQREIAPDAPTPTPTATATATATSTPTNTPLPAGCQAVAWVNKVNVTAYGSPANTIKKTAGVDGWNAGASSNQAILSGDGYVESVAVDRTAHTIFGLSKGDGGQDYTDIDYAIHLQGEVGGWPGDLVIFEGGVQKANFGPTYQAGDVFRVAVVGGAVKYYKNGTLLYTSSSDPSYPLVFDGSIFHMNAKVQNALICSSQLATATPTYTPQPGDSGDTSKSGTANAKVTTTSVVSNYTSTPISTSTKNKTSSGSQGAGRDSITSVNTLIYLHSDHLGSVGAATNASATPVSSQEYDPWGKVRTGGVTQTKRNYTGQKLDDTGLLFYNARYYDAGLGRFVSADSIVPGGIAPLTVDFHESSSVGKNSGSGPQVPQALNRYSYVQNRPLRYTDPTGHCDPDNCPQGSPMRRSPYRDMVHATFGTLSRALRDRDFERLRGMNVRLGQGLAIWGGKVERDGAWDAGKDIRALYGGSAENVPYFNAGGRTDVAYSLFGNILFGYLGAGVGYSSDNLDTQGAAFDGVSDPKGPNDADQAAIAFGTRLWEQYGRNITEADLAREIEEYIRTHRVHTRKSVTQCLGAQDRLYMHGELSNSVVAGLRACNGEAP